MNWPVTIRWCNWQTNCSLFIFFPTDKYNKDPTDSARVDDFISLNQNLFRTLAICGLIETAFKSLIDICEDDHELDSRRGGAEFWANQVAGGFILFKEVKRLFKAKKDKVHNLPEICTWVHF